MKEIAIFGSTGSIGKNAINVIKQNPNKFKVKTLIAKNDYKTLILQALELKPQYVVIENPNHFQQLKDALINLKDCEVLCSFQSIIDVAKIKYDLVISAIVGFAGLLPTIEAIKAKSNIAIANKESLVCAGKFIIDEVIKNNIKIIPIDSEHNAIFQIFENDNLKIIDDIVLTASGGPFFKNNKNLSQITVEEALNHPNWQMGKKISIDSATMMNKGLEMIEAFYLFPIKKNQIKIIVHPQSIIHGIVNYQDGSTLAMMSLPDMQVPISFALNHPQRQTLIHQKLDLVKISKLDFLEVDHQKFPALKICQEALEVEGNALVILNASNEIAVNKFLNKEITFDKITSIIKETLNKIPFKNLASIEEVLLNDLKAREIASSIKF